MINPEIVIDNMPTQDKVIAELRRENEQLRYELAKWKPSWDDAPDWAQWVCIENYSIDWWWYEDRPTISMRGFVRGKKRDMSAKEILWIDTLDSRPSATEETP